MYLAEEIKKLKSRNDLIFVTTGKLMAEEYK
jgi:hypothetical protein